MSHAAEQMEEETFGNFTLRRRLVFKHVFSPESRADADF